MYKCHEQGYITYTEQGRIQLSKQLETPQILGVDQDMRITLAAQHQDYLAYHREHIYKH